MKQGRMWTGLALAALVAFAVSNAAIVQAAPRKPASSAVSGKRAAASMRQFSGVVTALDKSSLTVEKSGKNARSMVFARHAEMRTTGELEKDARVTVWYRDEGGRPVAHRVVVKSPPAPTQG